MMQKQTVMKMLRGFIVATGTSLVAASALADGEGKRMFDRIDSDGDGYVSFSEFKLPRQPERKADLNNDGQVTREEVIEHASARADEMRERATAHFARMDLNGDNVITEEEAKEAMFYHLDSDQDGYLSPEELKRPKHRGRGKPGRPFEG
jgi:Ca2+-binding EF-hand superfamily protein